MDGRTLIKLMRDSKLIDENLTRTDVDILFAKYKDRGKRTITFKQFKMALNDMASKKNMSYEEIARVIIACRPRLHGVTHAKKIKFYDDASQYTGVFKHSGGPPTTIDKGPSDLAHLLDRSPSDIRGVKIADAEETAPTNLRARRGSLPFIPANFNEREGSAESGRKSKISARERSERRSMVLEKPMPKMESCGDAFCSRILEFIEFYHFDNDCCQLKRNLTQLLSSEAAKGSKPGK